MEDKAAKKMMLGNTCTAKMYAQLPLASARLPNMNSVPLWLRLIRSTKEPDTFDNITWKISEGHSLAYTEIVSTTQTASIVHLMISILSRLNSNQNRNQIPQRLRVIDSLVSGYSPLRTTPKKNTSSEA